eukprot:Awhi_evm1s11209
MNTAIVEVYSHALHYKGVPQICVGSGPSLSNTKYYSTTTRIHPSVDNWSSIIAEFLKIQNWERVGLVGTDDGWAKPQILTVEKQAKEYGIDVVGRLEFPFGQKDDPETRENIRSKLFSMKEKKVYVFFFAGFGLDAQLILEEAHKLGMVGNDKYQWLHGVDLHFFLKGWAYGEANPDILRGFINVSPQCSLDRESDVWVRFANKLAKTSTPDTFSCFYYDSSILLFEAINRTLTYMTDEEIPLKCIEYDYFYANLDRCGQNDPAIWDKVNTKIYTESKCDLGPTLSAHLGVCELLSLFQGIRLGDTLHYYQAFLLNEMYKVEFEGTSGHVSLDRTGQRSMDGVVFAIQNARQLSKDSNGKPVTTFDLVGGINVGATPEESSLDLFTDIIYPGGTFDQPNLVPAVDELDDEFYELPLGYRIFALSLTSILLIISVIFLILFYRNRKLAIVKGSTKSMMYLMMTGAILSYASLLILNALPYPTDYMCVMYQWLRHLGWALSFLTILLKTYRIKTIFCNEVDGAAFEFPDSLLLKYFSVLFSLMIVYLTIWSVVDLPGIHEEVIFRIDDGNLIETTCKSGWFEYALLIVEFLFVLVGVVLAFYVNGVPSFFNESKVIGITIYNWVLIFGISSVMLLLLDLDATAVFAVNTSAILLTVTIMVICFFGVRLFKIYFAGENKLNFNMASSKTSKTSKLTKQKSKSTVPSNQQSSSKDGLCVSPSSGDIHVV